MNTRAPRAPSRSHNLGIVNSVGEKGPRPERGRWARDSEAAYRSAFALGTCSENATERGVVAELMREIGREEEAITEIVLLIDEFRRAWTRPSMIGRWTFALRRSTRCAAETNSRLIQLLAEFGTKAV